MEAGRSSLYDLGILTVLDTAVLELYCQEYECYTDAKREIGALKERVKQDPSLRVDPGVWRIPRMYRENLRRSAAAFGMHLDREGRMDMPGAHD